MAAQGFTAPTPAYWEDSWQASSATADRAGYLAACSVFDPVLAPLLAGAPGRAALEVGCYPGGFLHHLGTRFGYEVSGIDVVPGTDALADTLGGEGVQVGKIWRGDFLTEAPRPEFDLVCSFGFVEHFDDPGFVISRHAQWLAPGGLLVVTVPHFRRAQWLLHRWLDRRSLNAHNLAAMSPAVFASAFAEAGVAPVHLRRFGTCEFWVEPDPDRSHTREQVAALAAAALGKAGSVAKRLAGPAGVPNPLMSPFLVAVGRRR